MVTLKLFTDFEDVLKLETVWNCDFALYFESPGLFSRFFCGLMHFCETQGWTPLIFTFWSNNRLVGVAPLKLRKILNTKYVINLSEDNYSDFYIFDEYRDQCVQIIIEVLFNQLKCNSATLTLENPYNITSLTNNCPKNFNCAEKNGPERAIIHIEKSYDQFYNSLKRKVRKNFRNIRRKFDSLKSWKVVCSEINSDSIKRIQTVERNSWKDNWRKKNHFGEDHMLQIILDASQTTEKIEPIYSPKVWFLEINGLPIAYQIVLLFKEQACLIKTSYDADFKKYSPGKFLSDEVIHELFKMGNVKKIDFITNLPFVQVWKPTCQNRIQITIEKKSLGLSVIRRLLKLARELRKRYFFSKYSRFSAVLTIIESKIPIK